nr:DNA translocase FtsK 4TM domain-containing protein [Thermoanaerobaculia bacterium]
MSESPRNPEAPRRRRDEFLGILLVAAGLLLVAALFSYDPADPSLFSAVADPDARPGNWAGRVGASFADGALQFFGFAAFALPAVVLALGVARFRSRAVGAWGTKALGVVVVLLSSAPLCHLAFGRPRLLGGGLGAGGFVGDLVAGALVAAFNPPGAAIALLATLLIGLLLVASLSLGEAVRRIALRSSASLAAWRLERERRRQVEEKERTRRAVVKKHLERAMEEPPPADEEEEAGGEVVAIPSLATLRVRERSGAGQFSVRRTAGPPVAAGAEGSAAAASALSPAPPPRPSPVARPAQLKKTEPAPQR